MTQAPLLHGVPAFACDSSVRRSGVRGRFVLGGSPIRLFSLTAAGSALMDRIEVGAPFDASPAECELIDRWIDAGLIHPQPALAAAGLAAAGLAGGVTVVVPVRDRAAGLERLLASLAADSAAGSAADSAAGSARGSAGSGVEGITEIIIVDDGSVQPLVIQLSDARLPPCRVIRLEQSVGPAQARNLGLEQVSTPLVAFVDSDCTVSLGWLEPLLEHFGDASVVAVAPRVMSALRAVGRTQSRPLTALEQYEIFRSPLDLGAKAGRVSPGTRVSYVPSAALLMRTDVVRAAGGFNPAMRVGEDVDLIWRLLEPAGSRKAGRVRYQPASVVHHEIRSGLGQWARQRIDYGSSAAALERAHPGMAAPVVMSPWSAAVWGLVATGHAATGAALAVGTTAQLRKKLPDLPIGEVARLGIGGHLGAGRQLARSVQRVWWPVALPAAVLSSRARSAVLGAVVLTALDSLQQQRRAAVSELPGATQPAGVADSVRFVGLGLLDDMSYGAGVWLGCLRERSLRALLPSFTRPIPRKTSSNSVGA